MAPLKRSATPDDCAEAVLALVRNRYVTGEIFVVDGGLTQVSCSAAGAGQPDAERRDVACGVAADVGAHQREDLGAVHRAHRLAAPCGHAGFAAAVGRTRVLRRAAGRTR